MLAATVVSGRMTSASAAVRLVALSYFRGSALGRAAAEAAATAAGVPGNRSWTPRSSSSTILMQLGDLPTSELGCTTENMSCRKIVVKAEEFGGLDFAAATKIVSPRELFLRPFASPEAES